MIDFKILLVIGIFGIIFISSVAYTISCEHQKYCVVLEDKGFDVKMSYLSC